MRTAGVDLAAQPRGTALAVIEWGADRGVLSELRVGVEDADIVETTPEVAALGIDCAFGWPDEFVSFVTGHADVEHPAPPVDGGMDWRRTLAYRETDREVHRITGRWPLSVSTDRLGLTAMRCAGLLGRLEARGIAVDRAGAGVVAEVYPGASLRIWGFDTSGYRTSAERRMQLLQQMTEAAPWLDLATFAGIMIASADAFDAVIAACAARSASLGRSTGPPAEYQAKARREGWIHLPTGRFADLAAE